jgi:glutathione synthase/RimK-type ligase-like ATP-grasp enzyme
MKGTPRQITTIGPREFVDFPDLGLKGIPAKIDTGADSSALWVSDIREDNGQVSFCLFDRTSPYYTGKRVVSGDYLVVSIKNSFGHAEYRYKVALRVKVARHLIRARFTLADRKHSNSPVLIGRRTLHGRFVVDVSSKGNAKPARLLLMSAELTPNVAAFVAGVERESAGKVRITHTTYDDVCFRFGKLGTHVVLLSTGEDIASFDVVHFKTTVERDVTAAMARYLQTRGVKVIDEAVAHFPDCSKLYQYVILTDNEVAIPDSLFVMPSRLPQAFRMFADAFGLPFILKGIHASRGEDNYLIRGEAEYTVACEEIAQRVVYVVAQAMVSNSGDYRILVMGRRISLVIHRSRTSQATHLNNTSKGGAATLIPVLELPAAVQTSVLMAAKVMGRGIAGVDMIQDVATKMWYCLEVNAGPQIATGAFVSDKQRAFAQFIVREVEK